MALRFSLRRLGYLLLAGMAPQLALAADPIPETVLFNRDVRPIFADKCFACHGPDENKREADLRLDLREAAVADRGGYRVIAAGQPDESELLRRVTTDDGDERMPPGGADKALSARQIEILRRWIEQGAGWQEHWAWLPPRRVEPPFVEPEELVYNEIDAFILRRLEQLDLPPSPLADRRTILRRLNFDLLGLPPTMQEVLDFQRDTTSDAYERVVDRLLSSEHFGERMAISWLDVVRYADTGGYHSDNHRDVAPYRDYVIEAFNRNLPFDQFTIEQIAGDLLPDATRRQKIATGYNRLLQTTEEGGAQPKEYTAKYQADRVRNTAAAWLGITMGCAECHDHKFDPFTMKDFYSFAAFFADVNEKPVGRQDQTALPSAEQQAELERLEAELREVRRSLDEPTEARRESQLRWERELQALLAKGESPEELPAEVREALAAGAEQRTAQQQAAITAHYRASAPELASWREQVATLESRIQGLRDTFPQSLITVAVEPRVVRILPRGNWLDDSGEVVDPAFPSALPRHQISARRAARLALAEWFVSPDHPLTARVFVNRLWRTFFGSGIVRTLDDFGTQGQWPSHPELLDWLAVEFIDSGWDVKHLVKLMVTSRTYQQSSRATPAQRERDPTNRWLARQARFRLDAEMVRDNALAISGILSTHVGGPSVKPYQPAGYWQHLNFPKRTWEHDRGDRLYRRGLYTYWQRTFLHPSLMAFDAPSREECTVERPRSNTPLQALVLLNDPTYVEAARAFAARILAQGEAGDVARLNFAFQEALSRNARSDELPLLLEVLTSHRSHYQQNPEQARQLLEVGESPRPEEADRAELAAWTSVARVILNLHETITRY